MKNITILAMLLVFAIASIAQQNTPNQNWKESDLYKKSKSQKTWGWILAGTGTVGLIVTLGVDASQLTENMTTEILSFGYVETTYKTYTGYYVASGAVLVAGVYLLYKAAKNKNKARASTVFIDMEKAHVLQGTAYRDQMFPVVGLRIHL
jgi:hypothetical protein